MINNQDFAGRLKMIMEHFQLTAATFADRIGVQPSSISHLLAGRNKPSLDFVMKVLEHYKEVELYWLLNGKGQFPKSPINPSFSPAPISSEQKIIKAATDSPHIDKIIVFYKDGHFKAYEPS